MHPAPGLAKERPHDLADLRRRLAVAEGALADALAAKKRAGEAFDAASDDFDAAGPRGGVVDHF